MSTFKNLNKYCICIILNYSKFFYLSNIFNFHLIHHYQSSSHD